MKAPRHCQSVLEGWLIQTLSDQLQQHIQKGSMKPFQQQEPCSSSLDLDLIPEEKTIKVVMKSSLTKLSGSKNNEGKSISNY